MKRTGSHCVKSLSGFSTFGSFKADSLVNHDFETYGLAPPKRPLQKYVPILAQELLHFGQYPNIGSAEQLIEIGGAEAEAERALGSKMES